MSEFDKEHVLEWLYGLSAHGVKLGLKNTTELLDRIGNPQNSFKSIHIAGSDGKGSTSVMIASVLEKAGVRTGLYTSPHLLEFNERISIDGMPISNEDIILLAHEIMTIVECMKYDGFQCTFFEAMTALAFLYFQRKGVEYAVIEVGMGGRFDATNVIRPEVSVITNISIEHTQYLGNTIDKIAFEKAGIIKDDIPVVTCNEGVALKVISNVAKERCSKLIKTGASETVAMRQNGSTISYDGKLYEIGIPGSFQASNSSMAIEALKIVSCSDRVAPFIMDGLREVKWPARMEKIDGLPIIVDVTHTKAGMKALCKDVTEIYGKVTVVFGLLNDKDLSGIAENVAKMAKKVVVTSPESDRAMPCDETYRVTSLYADEVLRADSVGNAIDLALKVRGDSIILVTGSFKMAEGALKWLRKTSA